METTKPDEQPVRRVPREAPGVVPPDAPRTAEETVERMADPPVPEPTQDEADALKERAHGEDGEDGEGADGAPTVVDVPAVGGGSAVGDTLTCTMGNWTGEPTGYAYQWQRDGADIDGTGDSYVIAAEDAGCSIACIVTATNANGSTTAPASNAVAVPAAGATKREVRPSPAGTYQTR